MIPNMGVKHRRWLLVIAVLLAVLGAVAAATGKSGGALIAGATAIVSAIAGFSGPLFAQWVAGESLSPPTPTGDTLEGWRRVLRDAVLERRVAGEGSQLDQMMRQGTVVEPRAKERIELVQMDEGRSRLRARGRTLAWSEIANEWDRAPGRLVILGEPGYGKTVAALTLLKHINAASHPGAPLAELFPLVEWYRWETRHPGGRLADWLVDQLTRTYSNLPVVAARALLAGRLIVPMLDGLDEVPEDSRRACKATIDAYAERSAPFRPFVMTCRVREYVDLAPDWVSADDQIGLVGLDREQIAAVLEACTVGWLGWERVRQRLVEGDRGLAELFRSPLRLMLTLHAYRDRDPGELLALRERDVEAHLWDLLLTLDGQTFYGAPQTQIRGWLAFLAGAMRREDRQRLWLHELYLLAPDQKRQQRRFALQTAVLVGLIVGLLFVPTGPFALYFAVSCGLVVGVQLAKPGFWAPSVRVAVPWRVRIETTVQSAPTLAAGVLVGLLVGATTKFGWSGALVGAVTLGLTGSFVTMWTAGSKVVTAEPSRLLDSSGPMAVLNATRRNGLLSVVVGIVFAILLFGGALVARNDGHISLTSLTVFLVPSLSCALGLGLQYGLKAWLYYQWLRHRLARLGLLPRRLREFLDWCTSPERGWLRVSDAYEFRHRALLDHLAPDRPPAARRTAHRPHQ